MRQIDAITELATNANVDTPLDEKQPSEKIDDKQTRAALIKHRALELGFHKIGIVAAEELKPERAALEAWTRSNFHGEMKWMAANESYPDNIARRTNPHLHFPAARSVIVVALNYYTAHEHEERETHGKLSRYAWGDDYHDVVGEKLRALLDWIKEKYPETEGKVCCDIQPMMDKAWAARAGLGWIGKHSNLITRDYGSWVFLGELIVNLELAYDTTRENDYCGTCRLCLDACPTKAITEERIVDARLCLSYHTIESRAATLPGEITENQQSWLYGCDVCQDVCPWNRFEKPTEETRFEPRAGETSLALDAVLQMTPERYAARFSRSAIKRAKLSGLQRNARALTDKANAKDESLKETN